jgi:dipeptidyl aminopeptidase/acylaminoacyl peptidase
MTIPEYAWTPERLIRYPLIVDLDISADGTQIVYAMREPVLTEDESRFVNHLYRVPSAGGEPLRLTYGPASQSAPRWSPDGRHIAFLSDRLGGKMNLYVLRADGGEAWPLTDVEKDVQAFAWSQDGSQLAFVMVAPDSAEKKTAKKAKNDPVLWDVDHERAQLWVLPVVPGDAPRPTARPITSSDHHVTGFDWAPDGQTLVIHDQDTPGDDHWPTSRLAAVDVAALPDAADAPDLAARRRDLGKLGCINPACPTFGRWAASAVGVEPVSWAFASRVALYPIDGGEPRTLAPTPDGTPWLFGWSADGKSLYVLENSGVSSAIYTLPADGSAPQPRVGGQGYLSLARVSRNDVLAFVAQDLDRPNRICVLRPGESAWQEVATPVISDWPAEAVPRSEVIHWPSADGLDIEGIVTYPLHYHEGVAYPMVVMVHGGPAGVYARTYDAASNLYPIASFAERGYVVLRANPRGSGGYGPAFRASNKGDWGGGDYRDIMAGVDLLIARGIADPERLGIMGWSYGGYMTSWVITQTSRFRAASVGAGVTNLISFTGASDITRFLPDYFSGEYWDAFSTYVQHSPMLQIKGVTTPTFIQHGEQDRRVPLEQGLELYNALKHQGVPVEMVIYPRQAHGPSEPRLIMDIMARNIAWFDRWLKKD